MIKDYEKKFRELMEEVDNPEEECLMIAYCATDGPDGVISAGVGNAFGLIACMASMIDKVAMNTGGSHEEIINTIKFMLDEVKGRKKVKEVGGVN